MTDYDETRKRRRRKVQTTDKPKTETIFFACPDVNCNHCVSVVVPANWKKGWTCPKCGKEVKRA